MGGEERTNYPLILSLDDLGEGFSLNVQAVAGIGAQRVCGICRRPWSSWSSPRASFDLGAQQPVYPAGR
ncbi:hypothetical protein QNM99_26450 [Pseudomonas sp. PCH446]